MKDMFGLMKQAQQMQERMQALQAELDETEVEGASGAGMVKVTMTAKGALKAIRIDPGLAKPDEAEILEDLIVAAHADARAKSERLLEGKMKSLTGGLPLPPGLKLF